jgi:hypothetical protein
LSTSIHSVEPPASAAGMPVSLDQIEARSGIDYALRTVQQAQVQYSMMADAKANIMITVCSIVISVSLTQLHRPGFFAPLLTLDFFTGIALLAALLCVLPMRGVPRHPDGSVDPASPAFNLLFFMHFHHLSQEQFERELGARLSDSAGLYRSLARDIHAHGVMLARTKYRYLRLSYTSFIAGLLLGTAVTVAEHLG